MPACRKSIIAVCLALLLVGGGGSNAWGGEVSSGSSGSQELEILNAGSPVRVNMGFRTPVVSAADGQIRPMPFGRDNKPMPSFESAPPPADWKNIGFDDLSWLRTGCPVGNMPSKEWGGSLQNHRLCMRGKFIVDDPGKVSGLRLTVSYRGGVIAYLNGVEVKRQNLPAGELKVDTVAEKYPDDAYAEAGALLKDSPKRIRKLDVSFSAADLKKGVNVLAVEVFRAPLNDMVYAAKGPKEPWREPSGTYFWPHLRLEGLSLTAAPGSAVQTGVDRPKGVQVWTVQPLETITASAYGDPAEKAVIKISGARNGSFSGRFVIGSDAPLKGVKVTAGVLTGDSGASIPVPAIRVRYAVPAHTDTGWIANMSKAGQFRYDLLEDTAPPEIPVVDASQAAARKFSRPGAVLPVWVTVAVPADAKPGVYSGEIAVSAEGLEQTRIPVSIKVAGWSLPDPDDYAGVNDFTQSHESVALAYKEPLWTDRHFELMGKGLELGEKLGSRFCYLNVLIDGHCMGNSEGMVRWIPKADGTYDYDFGPFDRYLDLFTKKVGKPRAIVVTVWITSQHGWKAKVSKLDPATKKVEPMDFPPYNTPDSVKFWKPVLSEIRKKVEARGLWDVTLIGHTGDFTPKPAEVDCFKAIWPDGKWIFSAHMATTFLEATDKSKMPVVVGERVWGCGRLYNPDVPEVKYGTQYPQRWNTTKDRIELVFPRTGQGCMASLCDDGRLALWRLSSEAAIQGNIHGFGRVGLDFWPIPGRKHTHWDSLAGSSNQGMGHSTLAIIGVGKDGPVATERYEMCLEGVQVREAILFVQRALAARKGSEALLKRAKDLLDERARHYIRTFTDQNNAAAWVTFEGGGWQERDNQLFALCAEIAETVK